MAEQKARIRSVLGSFSSPPRSASCHYVSYSLNSLERGYIGDYIGDHYRVIKGDNRSLDNGSRIISVIITRSFILVSNISFYVVFLLLLVALILALH